MKSERIKPFCIRKIWSLVVATLLAQGSFASAVGMAPPSADPDPRPTYRAVKIKGSAQLKQLRAEVGVEGIELIERINRRDQRHFKKNGVLQVPDVVRDALEFSPFPGGIEQIGAVPKLVLVSLRVQAFATYEYGRLVRWGPVSSGTEKQATPANLYYTNWRERRKVSTINSSWIMNWYFNLHTSMGVAFHQYDMPGFPASFGCVRLLNSDAKWIYDWADEWGLPLIGAAPTRYGTPVIVFGEFAYSKPPPWDALSSDPAACDLKASELSVALERYLWVIVERLTSEEEPLAE
jgi:lipoprotein-anchoring transpeptidase ErfK/SrfK